MDTLTGGAGADTFVLGEAGTVFYADELSGDLANITDFVSNEDTIQLAGSSSDYVFDIGLAGFSIILDVDNSGGLNTGDDVIATVSGTFNNADFNFV